MYKPSFPYLVDICITKKCNQNCHFCYQNSNENGEHADTAFVIGALKRALYNNNVFDCVFGGGEPTLHPDIGKILKSYKLKNFKVSLTTKNYKLYEHSDLQKILLNIDSIAFSCNSIKEYEEIKNCLNNIHELYKTGILSYSLYNKFYIQVILGLTPFLDTLDLIKFTQEEKNMVCGIGGITFLGYKSFGRGISFSPYLIPEDWHTQVKGIVKDYYNIGIDSVLAQKYFDSFVSSGINKKYLLCKEGISTCYVDAVNQYIKRSSFTEEGIKITKNITATKFKDIFSTFE